MAIVEHELIRVANPGSLNGTIIRGIERIYPNDSRVRQETIAHHVARYKFAAQVQTPSGNALDVCCGTGYGTEILRAAGYNARGFDISPDAIEFARGTFPLCGFQVADINTAGFGANSLVTFFEAIEHLPFKTGLKALGKARTSIQSGIFVVSTPRDLNEQYNHFHKSKWEADQLREVLGAMFTTVDMLGQDWDTALISDVNVRGNNFYIAVCTQS